MPDVDRQLRLLRAYALLTYPFACVPFLFLFFQRCGIGLADYGTAVSIYYVVMFVADVPTSMLADRLGQRAMLVAGPLVLALGFATLFVWHGFAGACAGEALLGLGHSILSGPPSSLLYDLLRRHGQQHRYLAEEARIHGRRLWGTGASFLLGGVCAQTFGDASGPAWSASIPPTALLCCGAAALALRTERAEPPARLSLREFAGRVRQDLWLREVRWLLLYWVVLFALLRYPFHNYQVFLDRAAVHEPLFAAPLFIGGLYALLNFVAAPLSKAVPRLVERFGRRPLFWGMPLLLCASLLAMAGSVHAAAQWPALARPLAWLGVAMFFAQQIPFGMHWALVQEFVNHRIRKEARSTVWSVLSLGGRSTYAGVNQQLFLLQQTSGDVAALSVAGLGGSLLTALVLWLRPRGLLRAPVEVTAE